MGEISITIPDCIDEEIDEYRHEHDLSESEAIRRLLHAGLCHTEKQALVDDVQGIDSQVSDLADQLDELEGRVQSIEDRHMWLW